MILYNIVDPDQKQKFFDDAIDWTMPVFFYRASDNENLVLVVWNEVEDQTVIDEFIKKLSPTVETTDIIVTEDEPLYEDGEDAFDDNMEMFL